MSAVKTFPVIFLFAILFSACSVKGFAQPKKSQIKKAEKLFEQGAILQQNLELEAALIKFEEAIGVWPKYGDALYRSGTILYTAKDYEHSYQRLIEAEANMTRIPPRLYFYLGDIHFMNDEFADAEKYYALYLKLQPRDKPFYHKTAEKNVKTAAYAKTAMDNKIAFDPINLGPEINSPYGDYMPNLTADDELIFFTSRRSESLGGRNPLTGKYAEDFFYCERGENGKWQAAESLGEPVNTTGNEGAASFSPDGQFVYFTACNREDGKGSCDLYVAQLKGREWTKPQNLGDAINTEYWESQPCISGDGRTLYFVSNRRGGVGGYDIWFSRNVNGKWMDAENIDKPINTGNGEMSPFLHADGKTLYFASSGHPGFGGTDLFMSTKDGNSWTAPRNLGYPLNTSADESNLFINSSGEKGFVNSDRKGGYGKQDIYEFVVDPAIRPKVATFVRGHVLEEGTENPLGAEIVFINLETRDTIRSVSTNPVDGKFLLSLPMEEDYAAFTDKQGYLFNSKNFSLKDIKDGSQYFDLTIYLSKLTSSGTGPIRLDNIFYETGSWELKDESEAELDHLLAFLKQNPTVEIEIAGHTDDVGSVNDNKVLSEKRAGGVRAYLTKRGIAEGRVTAKGYGESKPQCDTTTDDCRALNRRTEFQITKI